MRLRLFALLGVFAVVPLASAQFYTAVDLQPVGNPVFETWCNAVASGQQGGYGWDGFNEHAVIWSNSSSSFIDLSPSSYPWSQINGTDGVHQVGYVQGSDFVQHAAYWSGSAPSMQLLPGVGSQTSDAFAISNGAAGGFVGGQAAYWPTLTSPFINLNPAGYVGAQVNGIGGSLQAGTAFDGSGGYAIMWSGTAASAVPLGPLNSEALATDGVQEVGDANGHAFLWTGSAASGIDLNPVGYASSSALAVSNGKQVGTYSNRGDFHAAVWSGSAASVVDLNQFLPNYGPGGVIAATSIAPDGTIGGYYADTLGEVHAVLWIPAGPPVVFSGFLQPINDPASPESVFKRGSTVPVKFKLTTSAGAPISSAEAHVSLTQLGAGETLINEQYYETPSDDGTTFHFNTGSGCYEYNLGTKNLVSGARYRITATWSTGSASVTIAIK